MTNLKPIPHLKLAEPSMEQQVRALIREYDALAFATAVKHAEVTAALRLLAKERRVAFLRIEHVRRELGG